MKQLLILVCFLMITSNLFYGEDTNNAVSYGIKLFNDETFTSFKSALNPGNIFGINEDLSGILKYYSEINWKYDPASFTAEDIGYLNAVTNSGYTNRLTEAFLSYHLFSGFIDIGKKKVIQSVSFLMSPIDFILNDSKDYSKNQSYNLLFAEGKFMANLDWFSDYGVFGICYIPELDFTNEGLDYFSGAQAQQAEARYSVNLSGIDTGLAVSHSDIWQAGASVSATIGDYIEVHGEAAYFESKTRSRLATNSVMTGFDMKNMKKMYEDLLTNQSEKIDNPFEIIIGGSYNTDLFDLMIEYYYNQSGFGFNEWNEIRKTAGNYRNNYNDNPSGNFSTANLGIIQNTIGGNGAINLCQHYGMVRLSNPPSEKLSLTATTVLNIQDLSGLEILSAGYSGWDNESLTGNLTLGFGDEYSEFRLDGQDWSINIELEIDL